MNKQFQYTMFFLLLCAIAVSCTTKPNFPDEPKITFVSLSENLLNEGDVISITVSFEDGDGNIGKFPGTTSNCGTNVCDFDSDTSCFKDPFYGAFLIDTKDSCFRLFDLPDFEPDGNIKDVSGEIMLKTPVFCKLPTGSTNAIDTLVYGVVIKDADQNYSNTVYTDPIYINCN